jgi:hypothetical protein
VRDFGIATSRKFILDAMAVNNKTVMAISVYPKKVIHFGRNFYQNSGAYFEKLFSSYF